MRSRFSSSFGPEVFFILTSTHESLWRILQITDSAFPTGGFAHSNGLEAAIGHGEIKSHEDLENFLIQALWQIGHAALPFVNEAFDNPEMFQDCDELSDVFLSNHVANRASRIQGRTFLATCEKAFLLNFNMTEEKISCFHYAPVFGVILKSLLIERPLMQRSYLQISLRGMLSASVRLGVVGPYQTQTMQTRLSKTMEKILSHCEKFKLKDVAQTAPLLDLYQSNQDRLYSRLFQS